MNPSSSEIVEAIAETLRTKIAPLVADQPWPSSELRTIDALLGHVAQRLRYEDDVLREDDADLDHLLTELAAAGLPISQQIDPDASPAEANLSRRTSLETAIHLLHDGAHEEQVRSVRQYLVRAATRDHRVYGTLGERPLF